MTCSTNECERSGLYSNSVSNAVDSEFTFSPREKVPEGRMRGFTLAEVLITLGIIGVVAALAIPTLISNNNKRVVETRLAKFYSSINQSLELSEVENGPKEKWSAMSSFEHPCDWYNKYLADYSKTIEIKPYDEKCLISYPDGSLLSLTTNHFHFIPKAKDLDNSILGKTSFLFYYNPAPTSNLTLSKWTINKGIEPYKFRWDGTEDYLRNDSEYGCSEGKGGVYCTALIQYYGWKIPDDYPFKF